jgi:hypothetical protein
MPQIKLSKIEKKLENYLSKEKRYTNLFSPDGNYIIESQQIYICNDANYHDIEKIPYKSLSLLVDKTIYSKSKVISQLPVEYIVFKMIKTEYLINEKSPVTLIIEKSECEKMPPQIYFIINEKPNLNKKNPINLEILDILDNFFITNEIDEFLLCFYS